MVRVEVKKRQERIKEMMMPGKKREERIKEVMVDLIHLVMMKGHLALAKRALKCTDGMMGQRRQEEWRVILERMRSQ